MAFYSQTLWEEVAASNHLSSDDGNPVADIAWACTVYSMVPYLGILFVPLALAASGFGIVRAWNRPAPLRGRLVFYAGLSLLILAVQILFWWLVYLIPKIGGLR